MNDSSYNKVFMDGLTLSFGLVRRAGSRFGHPLPSTLVIFLLGCVDLKEGQGDQSVVTRDCGGEEKGTDCCLRPCIWDLVVAVWA